MVILHFVSVELMADMYENAHKMKPDNEEILSALFMAQVGTGILHVDYCLAKVL